MNEAQRIAHLGSWQYDTVNNALTGSEELYRIFEIDPAQFDISYESVIEAVHPDDRAMADKTYKDSLANHTTYGSTFRLLMKDGRVKWVLAWAETEYAEDGKPLFSHGTTQDITERKLAEDDDRERDAQVSELFNIPPMAIISVNSDQRIQKFNAGAGKTFGYASEDVIGQPLEILLPGRFRGGIALIFKASVRTPSKPAT